jgi:hypothetical protein
MVSFFARLITIKEDYRQYPRYPNEYLIHLVTEFVAVALCAAAIPAIMTKNFVAVTFIIYIFCAAFPNKLVQKGGMGWNGQRKSYMNWQSISFPLHYLLVY